MFKFNIRSAGQCASRTANRRAHRAKRKALTDGRCLLIQIECFTLYSMRSAFCPHCTIRNPKSTRLSRTALSSRPKGSSRAKIRNRTSQNRT